MEEKKKKQPLMSESEFKDYVHNIAENNSNMLHLSTFEAVSKFKSIRRAIRKGYVSPQGFIYPKRPFNNAKHSDRKPSHNLNEIKKMLYFNMKKYGKTTV